MMDKRALYNAKRRIRRLKPGQRFYTQWGPERPLAVRVARGEIGRHYVAWEPGVVGQHGISEELLARCVAEYGLEHD